LIAQTEAGVISPPYPLPDPEAVIAAMAWAHRTLIAASAFPEIARALRVYASLVRPFYAAWSFKLPRIGAPRPAGEDLAKMLKILTWVTLLPEEPPQHRRVIVLRSMFHPKTGAPRSLRSIGAEFRMDHHTIAKLHERAIQGIVYALPNHPELREG
jgi:hypothetical protein